MKLRHRIMRVVGGLPDQDYDGADVDEPTDAEWDEWVSQLEALDPNKGGDS